MSFNIEAFTENCLAGLGAERPQESIADLVRNELKNPSSVIDELGRPSLAAINKIYVSDELTIINVVWAPKMTLLPHNHNTWAVIGVYAGREDNIFWRRIKDDPHGTIEAAGAKSIGSGEVAALGKNLIHSVTNPTSSFTGAIHVYGGNFFEMERSEWDPESLVECPYDIGRNLSLFEAENAILKIRNAGNQND